MSITIGRAGDGTRGVWIICRSPAAAGVKPAIGDIRGHFSANMQYVGQKKSLFLPTYDKSVIIYRLQQGGKSKMPI